MSPMGVPEEEELLEPAELELDEELELELLDVLLELELLDDELDELLELEELLLVLPQFATSGHIFSAEHPAKITNMVINVMTFARLNIGWFPL